MATTTPDSEAVRRTLDAGQLTVVDGDTGHMRSLYANCPADGQPSPARRVVREHGGAITTVTMRCLQCGTDFDATTETLYLR